MMRDVMAAIVNPRIRTVSIVASIQSSKTLAPELSLAYIIANMPGPALWLDTTDVNAKNESESRLQPLFENCKPVKNLFPFDKNKKRNAAIFFRNGMPLWILGANNKRNLQSRSIRWLFGDETWLWAPGRMAEAEARVSAFGRLGKCVFFSQAGTAGDDTDIKFRSSDCRKWSFECPHCGKVQAFKWENLHWDPAAKDADSGKWNFHRVRESTVLTCEECGHVFPDSPGTRARLNASPRRLVRYAGKTAVSYYFSNLSCKDKLAQLRSGQAEPWGLPKDVPVNYLKQLQSEYRSLTAAGKPIWLQYPRRPNHYFDCETMQVCAAYMVKLFEKKEIEPSDRKG